MENSRIFQETESLVITPVACENPNPATEIREGGRGWVGREFKYWELYIFGKTDPNTARTEIPFLTGEVRDGYIILENEGDPKFLNKCGEEEDDGTVGLGENDPAWNFPFEVVDIPGPNNWSLIGQNGSLTVNRQFFQIHGQLSAFGGTSDPISVEIFDGSDDLKAFLRLKCAPPE